MLTQHELENAYGVAKTIIMYPGGFDSFKFRKLFLEDKYKTVNYQEKKQILEFLKRKLKDKKEVLIYLAAKLTIDKEEFGSTDYYTPLFLGDKQGLRGSYRNVIEKTVGGLMAFSISQDKEVNNGCSLH